nr:MAG TPA_asm: hypothetical protein [Caudoviricetes sp.]
MTFKMSVPLQYNTYFKQNIFSTWSTSASKLARRFHVGTTTKLKISVVLQHFRAFGLNLT